MCDISYDIVWDMNPGKDHIVMEAGWTESKDRVEISFRS